MDAEEVHRSRRVQGEATGAGEFLLQMTEVSLSDATDEVALVPPMRERAIRVLVDS